MTLRRITRLGFAAAAVALLLGTAEVARASLYGYAVQQTSAYSFTGDGVTTGPLTPLSGSSAAQVGSPTGGVSFAGGDDVLQSYVGPGGTAPAENTWTAKGQVDPDYARGDAQVTSSPDPFGTNNVAELFLGSAIGNAQGSGSWSVSATLDVASDDTIITLGFSYLNQLKLINSTPGGVVQADLSYIWTIRDSAGTIVFSASPTDVNKSISLTTLGTLDPGVSKGSVSIKSSALKKGSYTGTISGTENVFARAVPEPATWTLLAMGSVGMIGLRYRRKRNQG